MITTNGKTSKRIQLSFLRKLKVNKNFGWKIMLETPFLLIWLAGLTAGLNVDSCLIKELLYDGFGPQLFFSPFLSFNTLSFTIYLGPNF